MVALAYFAPVDSPGGLLNYLFGAGIGTNLGASLVWLLVGLLGGYFAHGFVRRELGRLHARHDSQDDRLKRIESKLEGL